jgi:hypothetical protein
MRSLHRDDFPAEFRKHLRTTNIIESSFADRASPHGALKGMSP